MSTDELRAVLQERAEVPDRTGPSARLEEVAGRVRGVRRRRRAVVGAVVAAAVVAAGTSAVPTMLRHTPNAADQKAPAVLAGRTVPQTQTATGYTYDYVRGVQSRPGADKLQLTVSAGSTPKLVMWATSSTNSAPVVRLRTNIGPSNYRSGAGGFERYVLVGETTRLTLTQRDAPAKNRLAMAVYALERTPPPGVSDGVVTFRRTILGDRLITGRIGEPGVTGLRTTIAPQSGVIRISDLCYNGSDRDRVHVSIGGDGQLISNGCSSTPVFDPGALGDTLPTGALDGSKPIALHVWLTGPHGRRISEPHAVLGVAAYQVGGATISLAGQRVPVRQQSDGHEYVVTRQFESRPGDRKLTIHVPPSDVPRLVTYADSGYHSAYAFTQLLVGGIAKAAFEDSSTGGATVANGYVIQPGESPTLTLRVHTKTAGRILLGLALSDQVH